MRHYFSFIAEWAGAGFLAPVMYVFTLAGPFAVLLLAAYSRQGFVRNLGVAVATCSFVAYFFICLGTGIYIGSFHRIGGWGIPLGFALFIVPVLLLAWAQNTLRRFRQVSTKSKL